MSGDLEVYTACSRNEAMGLVRDVNRRMSNPVFYLGAI
jgi:hypothetical protein